MTTQPLKPAEYLKAAREIEAVHGDTARTLAVISTFTAELLRPYLIVESHQLDCLVRPWFGPFGQLEQLVLDEASALWQQSPDVLWIAARLEDVDPRLVHDHPHIGPEATRQRLDAVAQRLVNLARAARDKHRASILVSNLTCSAAHQLNPFDANDPDGFVHLLAETNRQLARDLSTIPDANVFDYAATVASAGADEWSDPKLWYMARSGCSSDNMIPLARAVARATAAQLRPAAKCIVLDLDNTLWGGVLGDDGPEGIKLGDDYPGNVFKDFQAALLGLRHRGFLLAIASKNDEQTVLDMLDTHPEMLLARDQFAHIAANWDPKPVNLRRIAEALNIGLDSLVFVDDNPVERAAVRAELPMVHVVELPPDPLRYLAALRDVPLFDRPRDLQEDRQRADMYQNEAQRRQVEQQATSVEDFLRSLQMEAEVGQCDSTTLERIHQLIQKTNQFNLTTRRHNLEDVRRFAAADDARVAWLRLRDRYGDLGLVCVGIIEKLDERAWVVDTLLMSCRVMGRQVEDAFLSYLAGEARDAGAQTLCGVFRRTPKNTPVKDFYQTKGFKPVGGEEEQRFEAELTNDAFPWPDVICRVSKSTKESVGA